MLDDATTDASAPVPRCMWCSAPLPSESETTCPDCGATLISEGDAQVPGVTAIDAAALVGLRNVEKPRQRNRLMSWISGEYPEEEKPAPPGSLSPPPLDVRREMLRLELEAEVANLQAEAGAMAAEQAVEAVDHGQAPEEAMADAAATVAAVNEVTANVVEFAEGVGTDGEGATPDAAEVATADAGAVAAADATPAAEPAMPDAAIASEADPAT
jgi:hypothetical protein